MLGVSTHLVTPSQSCIVYNKKTTTQKNVVAFLGGGNNN